MGCGEIKSRDVSPCSHINQIVNSRLFYNPVTGEVFDEMGSFIGKGEPTIINGEIKAIDVSPIGHPLMR